MEVKDLREIFLVGSDAKEDRLTGGNRIPEEVRVERYAEEHSPTDFAIMMRAQGLKTLGMITVGGVIGNMAGEAGKGMIAGAAVAFISLGSKVLGYCFERNEQEPTFPV